MTGLERSWQRITPLAAALYPLSLVFGAIAGARRAAYRAGLLKTERVGVPVVVVGNITVGGTGKTPLVIWLADWLGRNGMRPGIVSRGYGARSKSPQPVLRASDARQCGDEPVLLAQRSDCPVWIGADRVAAARALLAEHRSCDVILSDDGLQHYRLGRDVEIAVVDGARGLGNGLLLPAGPLREPASRFESVDAVVVNGGAVRPVPARRTFRMRLDGHEFRNLLNPGHLVDATHFQHQRVFAVAGIASPARFFAHLNRLGVAFEARPFPDHHAYSARDIAFPTADAVLMTEKDAVKCAAFASEKHWVLPVDAAPDLELGELILRKLRS